MLTSILLTVIVSLGVQAAGQTGPDARAQAEQLARSGSLRAALEKFQAIVAANPDDIDARMWIARLYGSLGEPDRAIAIYQSILATNPQHLEALLGLADTLVIRDRLTEAAEALGRAEAVAPENAQVLGAQGRLHAAQGRHTLALAYYQRAITLDPNHAQIRAELDELRARRAHFVEAGYLLEHFDPDQPNTNGAFATVSGRVAESLRLSGIVQFQRKFSRNETRGGGGAEWSLTRNLRLYGTALLGGDALDFPSVDGFGGIAYKAGRATWSFDMRFADFDQANVNVGRAGLRIGLPHESAVWVNYYRFDTDYEVDSSVVVHSWALGGSGRVNRQWLLGAEYTRGPDRLDMLTFDRTGAFEADTVSGFAEFFFTPMDSLSGRYDYQSRPGDIQMQRVVVHLVHRF
jgi:tetratricopeptide (TPR) repeat protein